MSTGPSSRWRKVGLAVGAFVLLDVGLALTYHFWDSRAPRASSGDRTKAIALASPDESIVVLTPAKHAGATTASASGTASAPRRRLLASDPDPQPSVKNPTSSGPGRDPFVGGEDGPSVRTLATVGAIRVGVAKVASIKDEQKVTEILTELARELDAKEAGRTDDYEARAHDYHSLLDRYAGKLDDQMTGQFAFHGDGWILFKSVAPGAEPNAHP